MIRARFYTDEDDFRPIEWPIKYPYWRSRETHRAAISVALRLSLQFPELAKQYYDSLPKATMD